MPSGTTRVFIAQVEGRLESGSHTRSYRVVVSVDGKSGPKVAERKSSKTGHPNWENLTLVVNAKETIEITIESQRRHRKKQDDLAVLRKAIDATIARKSWGEGWDKDITITLEIPDLKKDKQSVWDQWFDKDGKKVDKKPSKKDAKKYIHLKFYFATQPDKSRAQLMQSRAPIPKKSPGGRAGLEMSYRTATKRKINFKIEDFQDTAPKLTDHDINAINEAWVRIQNFWEWGADLYMHYMLHSDPRVNTLWGKREKCVVAEEFIFMLEKVIIANFFPEEKTFIISNEVLELGLKYASLGYPEEYYCWSAQAVVDLLDECLPIYNQSFMHDNTIDAFKKLYVWIASNQLKYGKTQMLKDDHKKLIKGSFEKFKENFTVAKQEQLLMKLYKQDNKILKIFSEAEIPQTQHLTKSLEMAVKLLDNDTAQFNEDIQNAGMLHFYRGVTPEMYTGFCDIMCETIQSVLGESCTEEIANGWRKLLGTLSLRLMQPGNDLMQIYREAEDYLARLVREDQMTEEEEQMRLAEIKAEILAKGTYTQTFKEMSFGAKLAWRNASRCIGRIQWHNLIVQDGRDLKTADEIFRMMLEHIKLATNGGKLVSYCSMFAQKHPTDDVNIQIWNQQLLRYAGYKTEDGKVIGDPATIEITEAIMDLGWQPPEPKTPFDILPIVIQMPGERPAVYEIPQEEVLEIRFEHPDYDWWKDLGLKWYAVPGISDFRLECGGVHYTACAFNGWYMETEIIRDFLEEWRYDKAKELGKKLGLNTNSLQSLWIDRVMYELARSVLHSFAKAGVTIVDHFNASKQYMIHEKRERLAHREVPSKWAWVVPPMAGSMCPVWHHEMRDFVLKPLYHYQIGKWRVIRKERLQGINVKETQKKKQKKQRLTILYGSETGTAEGYAYDLASILKENFESEVEALDSFDYKNEWSSGDHLVLFVVSTFGQGEPPYNAVEFYEWLLEKKSNGDKDLRKISYSVFALGSRVYEDFCAYGKFIDSAMSECSARRLASVGEGDELKDQEEKFSAWSSLVHSVLCQKFGIRGEIVSSDVMKDETQDVTEPPYLLEPFDGDIPKPKMGDNAGSSQKFPYFAKVEQVKELHSKDSDRSTVFVELDIASSPVTYLAGDHVAVYPKNDPDVVETVADLLDYDLDDKLQFTKNPKSKRNFKHPLEEKTTVETILSEGIEFLFFKYTVRDALSLFSAMEKYSEDKNERRCLNKIVDGLTPKKGKKANSATVVLDLLQDKFLSLKDLFEAFPHTKVPIHVLLHVSQPLKPRFYSISSSLDACPDKVQLTVAVVVEWKGSKTLRGVCSNYLANRKKGDEVRIFFRHSNFGLPDDPFTSKMMFVGPGTGVAPFRGLLQQLEHEKKEQSKDTGDVLMFFGCRYKKADFLYEDEWEKFKKSGVLTDLALAFSREGPEKVYVQHLIKSDEWRKKVWEVIKDKKGYLYICGDTRMANDVHDAIIKVVEEEGKKSEEEANELMESMKTEARYLKDVWGVQFHFDEALQDLKKEIAEETDKWFKRLENQKRRRKKSVRIVEGGKSDSSNKLLALAKKRATLRESRGLTLSSKRKIKK